MAEVERVLEWFADDRLVGRALMPAAQLAELQALFDVPARNPMYDCWPVGPAQAATVSMLAGVPVELDRFEYFVTAESVVEGNSAEPAAAPHDGGQ